VADYQEIRRGVILEVEADCRRPLDDGRPVLIEYHANDGPVAGEAELSDVRAIGRLEDPHLAAGHLDDVPLSAKKPTCGTAGLFGRCYDVTLVLSVTPPPRQAQFTGTLRGSKRFPLV
jgi:hypothetical protein